MHPVRLAYQPPASNIFLSEQTSHQPTVFFSRNKSAPVISHQPNKQADGVRYGFVLFSITVWF
jgi:hypothetical protein